MHPLPPSLLALLLTALTPTHASPQPPFVSDAYIHLIPRHTLFLRQTSNLQSFTQALGGVPASAITNSGDAKRPFEVDGNTFTDFKSAGERSCDRQKTGCSDEANKQGNKGAFTVNDCDKQKEACSAAQDSAPVKDFGGAVASTNIGPDPNFPDFDLICDA